MLSLDGEYALLVRSRINPWGSADPGVGVQIVDRSPSTAAQTPVAGATTDWQETELPPRGETDASGAMFTPGTTGKGVSEGVGVPVLVGVVVSPGVGEGTPGMGPLNTDGRKTRFCPWALARGNAATPKASRNMAKTKSRRTIGRMDRAAIRREDRGDRTGAFSGG